MIIAENGTSKFEGTPKELTLEFTSVIMGFKQTMITEFDLSEDEVFRIIKLCGEIAFMSDEERQDYLNHLLDEE